MACHQWPGGYASGTVAGTVTRRYHGLLIAALPEPLGRTMMLNRFSNRFAFPGRIARTSSAVRSEPRRGEALAQTADTLREFRAGERLARVAL